MSFFQKLKSKLPVSSGSFSRRLDELEAQNRQCLEMMEAQQRQIRELQQIILSHQQSLLSDEVHRKRIVETRQKIMDKQQRTFELQQASQQEALTRLSAMRLEILDKQQRTFERQQASQKDILARLSALRQDILDKQQRIFDAQQKTVQRGNQDLMAVLNQFYIQSSSRVASLVDDLTPVLVRDEQIRAYAEKLQLPVGGRREIPVVFITDSQYLIPMMTTASSLLRHSNGKNYFRIHVLAYNLTEEEIRKYSAFSPAITIHSVCKDYSGLTSQHLWVSPAALLKFDLPNTFAQYDKILYLDSDMLVYEDLTELFDTDLTDCYAAVVKDFSAMVAKHHRKLQMDSYFNSGMMLLNLKKMREDGITEKLFEAKKSDEHKDFMDQDAFNVVFHEQVKYMSPYYNLMLANLIRHNVSWAHLADFYGVTLKAMKRLICHPAIQHLSNIDKPWYSPLSVDYEQWQKEYVYWTRVLAMREQEMNQ